MDISIQGMAYSPIEYGLESGDQWQNSVGQDTASELDVFAEYITEVIVKSDQSNVTRGNFDTSGTATEGALQVLCDTDYEDGQSDFCDAAFELTKRLNDVLHHTANEGVLFAVQAGIEGEVLTDDIDTVAVLLKLDLEEAQRVKLKSDNTLKSVSFEDLFPEPEELQKAVMYPLVRTTSFRLPGDVKFYQKDTLSEYFHRFIECDIAPATLEQAKSVFEAISEIKHERTGQRADAEDLNRFRALREDSDGGVVELDEITSAASDIVGETVSGQDLADELGRDNPDAIVMDSNNLPSVVKYEVDEEIEVKFPSTASERVNVNEDENEVEISITGGDLTVAPRDR
ncbi:nucleoid-associated protein [Natronoarchaeum mannanilyticum]|uniref:Nucleoid-associated protein n=1 Tax=Natronoarchaeum mannanilyticum TaxID=926360 RepID=A0AAV3TC84_9EURY